MFVPTYDDELAALVAVVPGFGGLFYDSSGTLTVAVKHENLSPASRAAVLSFLKRSLPAAGPGTASLDADVAQMRIVAAEHDFAELVLWKRTRILPAVGSDVNYIDIDERRNRIVLGVWDAAKIGVIRNRVAALGMPATAVEVINVAPSYPDVARVGPKVEATGAFSSGTLRDHYRPVPGGVQIRLPWNFPEERECTLGYNVMPVSGGDPSARYAITNSHCSRIRSVVDNGDMYQPTAFNIVGSEVADPGWFDNADNPNCPVGRQCRFTDASLYGYITPSDARQGDVALPPVGSIAFSAHAVITATYSPTVGRTVHKIGRTTGRTAGTVTNTCVDEDIPGSAVRLLCIGIGSYTSGTGDSGSPVIEPFFGGTAWAVGVHHASGGRFSPMYSALNELYQNNTSLGFMDPTGDPPPPPPPPPPGPTVSITGPAFVSPNTACVWESNVSGTGPFTYLWTQDGAIVGSSPTVTTSFASSGTLTVQVWDAYDQTASDSKAVSVSHGSGCGF